MPMPKRGEVVRQLGDAFRKYKKQLGALISLEVGKILAEGEGEVQEVIDLCDMAVGMSRRIGGRVFPSERPSHYMIENWNPIGIIGVITAFNFPTAVFGWNLAISMICGNLTMWKGSETTQLVSVAVTKIIQGVFEKHGVPGGVATLVCGLGTTVGQAMVTNKDVALISFTGSTWVGKIIAKQVAERFGKAILELGGNNCSIICPDANLDLALMGCTFGACGTTG